MILKLFFVCIFLFLSVNSQEEKCIDENHFACLIKHLVAKKDFKNVVAIVDIALNLEVSTEANNKFNSFKQEALIELLLNDQKEFLFKEAMENFKKVVQINLNNFDKLISILVELHENKSNQILEEQLFLEYQLCFLSLKTGSEFNQTNKYCSKFFHVTNSNFFKNCIKIKNLKVENQDDLNERLDSLLRLEIQSLNECYTQKINGLKKIEKIFRNHQNVVTCLEMLTEKTFLSGSEDGTINLWDTETGKLLKTFNNNNNIVTSLAVLTNESFLAGSWDRTIKLWNVVTGECVKEFTYDFLLISSLVSLSSEIFLSGARDNSIKLWNISSTEILKSFSDHSGLPIILVSLSNEEFLSGSEDKTVKLWNINEQKSIKTFTGHSDSVYSLAVISNDTFLSGSLDSTIKLWNKSNGDCIKTFKGHQGLVASLAKLSNDIFISASLDSTIKLWDINSGECLKTLAPHTEYVSALISVTTNQEKLKFLSGSYDHTIKLCEI